MPRRSPSRSLAEPARYTGAHTPIRADGYVYEYCPDHPACNPHGMVLQHRLVMECHLSRFLTGLEVVHHLNRVKTDNRLENLLLLPNQKIHRRLHAEEDQRQRESPDLIDEVLKAAVDPDRSMSEFELSPYLLRKICSRHGVTWVNSSRAVLDWPMVHAAIQEHGRQGACRMLGVHLQTLWNRFPEEMRTTANQKRLRRDGFPGELDHRMASQP